MSQRSRPEAVGSPGAPPVRPMTARSVAVFFGLFVLFFSAMMAIGGLQRAYAAYYRGLGNFVFSEVGEGGRCQFVALEKPDARMDTEIRLNNTRTSTTAKMTSGSRFIGYVPTALVLSLVLASPVGLRQRAWAFLWGVVACNLYVVLRIGLGVVRRFTMNDDLAIWTPGFVANFTIEALFDIFVVSSIGGFVFPILIWVLVTFRRRDWDRLLYAGRSSFDRLAGRRPPARTTAA